VRGIKVDIRDVSILMGFNFTGLERDVAYDMSKFIKEKFGCKLDVIAFRNYFDFDAKYQDVIIGLHSKTQLEDGEIVKVSPADDIDNSVVDGLKKIGYPDPQLATWVQYVSNDNC